MIGAATRPVLSRPRIAKAVTATAVAAAASVPSFVHIDKGLVNHGRNELLFLGADEKSALVEKANGMPSSARPPRLIRGELEPGERELHSLRLQIRCPTLQVLGGQLLFQLAQAVDFFRQQNQHRRDAAVVRQFEHLQVVGCGIREVLCLVHRRHADMIGSRRLERCVGGGTLSNTSCQRALK